MNIMVTVSRSLRRMRNVLDRSCGGSQNTYFVFTNYFRKSCHLWENVEKCGRGGRATDYNIIWRMRFARWIPKATDILSENVRVIAFPQQQWLNERAWILRYTYIASVVEIYIRMSSVDFIMTFSKPEDKYIHAISCVWNGNVYNIDVW